MQSQAPEGRTYSRMQDHCYDDGTFSGGVRLWQRQEATTLSSGLLAVPVGPSWLSWHSKAARTGGQPQSLRAMAQTVALTCFLIATTVFHTCLSSSIVVGSAGLIAHSPGFRSQNSLHAAVG